MHTFNAVILLVCLVMLAGCSSSLKTANRTTTDDMAARLVTLEQERHWLENNQERLVGELEAAKRRNVELEQRVDDLSRHNLAKAKQHFTQAQRP